MSAIVAYYNEEGYRIDLVDNSEHVEIYSAGNSKYDSYQIVSIDDALPLRTIKDFAEQTGRTIANKLSCRFVGSEYEQLEVAA